MSQGSHYNTPIILAHSHASAHESIAHSLDRIHAVLNLENPTSLKVLPSRRRTIHYRRSPSYSENCQIVKMRSVARPSCVTTRSTTVPKRIILKKIERMFDAFHEIKCWPRIPIKKKQYNGVITLLRSSFNYFNLSKCEIRVTRKEREKERNYLLLHVRVNFSDITLSSKRRRHLIITRFWIGLWKCAICVSFFRADTFNYFYKLFFSLLMYRCRKKKKNKQTRWFALTFVLWNSVKCFSKISIMLFYLYD